MTEKNQGADPHHLFDEEKKRDRVTKRMMNAYRRKRRDDAIQKLLNDPKRWEGLQ